jgi:hypothetical protein
MKKLIALMMLAGCYAVAKAQKPSVKKVWCNPVVLGQPATKRLSLIYELQTAFNAPARIGGTRLSPANNTEVLMAHNIRLGYTKNLVVKPKLYMSMAAGYWYSRFNITSSSSNALANMLAKSHFHSFTLGSNIFKPLSSKNFVLLNISLEANGNTESLRNFSGNNLLAGGALIYGWKKGVQRMWGIGAFRGYRLGRVIHVPALLYNHSFNKKWGVDALLPARANFRYIQSAKTMWHFGYELDGTQFAIQGSNALLNNAFFQRGEIRPRLGIEQQLNKTFVLTAYAGLRINGRFSASSDYNGQQLLAENDPRPAFFINTGIHTVKLWGKKKK